MNDWTVDEREAFFDHLDGEGGSTTLATGQTLAEYAADWKRQRDQAADALEPSQELIQRVLAAPVAGYVDEMGWTVRDYLIGMLAAAWADEFDPKYGTVGNSDWRYDLYGALNRAGIIPGWVSGYGIGYRVRPEPGAKASNPEDRKAANDLIAAAIRSLRA